LAAAPVAPTAVTHQPASVSKNVTTASVSQPVQPQQSQVDSLRNSPSVNPSVSPKENSAQNITKPKTGTFSINAALQASDKKDEVQVVLVNQFSKEDLMRFWNSFAETHKESSPSFALALLKYEPEMTTDYVIHFKVDNNLLLADKVKMNGLLEFLKSNLKNTLISLDPILVEAPVDKEAYTDREKFEKMAAHRPMLRLFKDELGLEAEI
jgi:DNA polymerase-3 subunit gamma/tau